MERNMHICPQEIMAVVGAIDILRPTLWMVKHWCESCFNGTHKSCDDHKTESTMVVSDGT